MKRVRPAAWLRGARLGGGARQASVRVDSGPPSSSGTPSSAGTRAPAAALSFGEGYLGGLGNAGFLAQPSPAPVLALAGDACVGVAAGWGHAAFLTRPGGGGGGGAPAALSLAGRPFDFKQTLRNISLRSAAPPLQRLMTLALEGLFPGELSCAPAPLPAGAAAPVLLAASPGSLTAVLCADGAAYALGSNAFGQCGSGRTGEAETAPARVTGAPPWEALVGLALGLEHGLAVSDAGALYAWGRGHRGQLGLGEAAAFREATRVAGAGYAWALGPGHECVAVAAGPTASAAIDARGRAWVWGKMQGAPGARARAAARAAGVPAGAPAEGDGAEGAGGGGEGGEGGAGAGGTLGPPPDAALPRRVVFAGEPLDADDADGAGGGGAPAGAPAAAAAAGGAGEGEGGELAAGVGTPEELAAVCRARVAPALAARNIAPPAAPGGARALVTRADTLPSGVVIDASPPDARRPPPAVAAVVFGHAHAAWLTTDGRLWLTGQRGRGRLHDRAGDAAGDAAGGGAGLPAALDIGAAVPGDFFQTTPLFVPPGPLGGARVRALRADLHHTYALTAEGRVFRWGWRGRVELFEPTAGLAVDDLALGYEFGLVAGRPAPQ